MRTPPHNGRLTATLYYRYSEPQELLNWGQLIQKLQWNDQFYRPWRPEPQTINGRPVR